MIEKKYWKMSPGYYAEYKDNFIKGKMVALGTNGTGDISKLSDDEIRDIYRRSYNMRDTFYLQLIEFLREFKVNDKVLLYGKKSILALGTIKGSYKFNDKFEYPHTRSTEWSSIFNFNEFPISCLDVTLQKKLMYNRTIVNLSDDEWNEIEYSIPR